MLTLFHSSVLALNAYSIWYDQQFVDIPYPCETYAQMPYKARPMFLTFWCLALQTVYFTIALLNDIFGTNDTNPKSPPIIRKIKDTLFSLAFTVATYVSGAFWLIYFTDKELILPSEVEAIIPSWLNHVWHTLVFVFILLELLFSKRNYPSRNVGITVATLFNIMYLCILVPGYLYTKIWVYPFLNLFSAPMIVLYFTCSSAISFVLYVLGEKLDRITSGSTNVGYNKVSSKLH